MRNEGLGSWPARAVPARPRTAPPSSTATRRSRARAVRAHHPPRPRPARPGPYAAATGSPTSAPTTPPTWRRCSRRARSARSSVPLNTRLAGPEIAYQLTDSRRQGPWSTAPRTPVSSPGLPGQHGRTGGYVEVGAAYERAIAEASEEPIDAPVGADDTCVIMYTSGTTGRPKGAMLTTATWSGTPSASWSTPT
ncbi:AMP-binding protein [Streptomyces tricolor]|nr:AMP-binding protein [Streptomyces tricolor]